MFAVQCCDQISIDIALRIDTSTHHFDGSLTRFVNKIRGMGSVTRLGGGRDDLGRSGAKQTGTT